MLNKFTFKGRVVRVIEIGGEPWWLGSDVIAVLEIDNSGNAYRRLDADERTNIRRTDVGMSPGRDLVAVSESGLYKLIMRSDKPEAREFQDWVTREVLPAMPISQHH